MDDISASQDTLEPLSQETLNTLIFSLGGQSAINGLVGNEFERIQTDQENISNTTSGDPRDAPEFQVSRTIITAIGGPSSTSMPQWPNSQGLSHGIPPATSNGHTPLTPAFMLSATHHNNGDMEPESPLTTNPHSAFTPPPSTTLTHTTPLTHTPTSTPVTPTKGTPGPSNPAASSTSRMAFPGVYGFEVIFDTESEKKISKTANFTYSKLTSRAYLKPKCAITFNFSFQTQPPPHCTLRAMAIYNTPELVGQHVYCCLADAHIMHQLFSSHFVRPYESQSAVFCGDGSTQACSIVTPFTNLTQKSPQVWYTVYVFPCVTSHLPHKKHVELMFTLELNGDVIGRCLVPLRVCTSPGRDRIIDEDRVNKERLEEEEPEPSLSRKRGAKSSSITEVMQYTMPPKRPCVRLSEPKVKHTIETHRELIPYIEVCVRMMEQVHSVPQTSVVPDPQTTRELFPSVEAWLDSLRLSRYAKIFKDKGIIKLYQVPSITEEELKAWGIRNASHRKKLITNKDSVIQPVKRESSHSTSSSVEQDGGGSPQLFSQSPPSHSPYMTRQLSRQISQGSGQSSQHSQLSSSSATPYTQSFEVVQIQLKKKLSNSTS